MAQSHMRSSVERHFQIDSGVNPISDKDDELGDEDLLVPVEQHNAGYFISRWFNWRVEEDGVITYRRNYFILFWEILLPTLVLGFLLVSCRVGLSICYCRLAVDPDCVDAFGSDYPFLDALAL